MKNIKNTPLARVRLHLKNPMTVRYTVVVSSLLYYQVNCKLLWSKKANHEQFIDTIKSHV